MNKLFRKVVKITAEDSPNVKYARLHIKHGKQPPRDDLIPGLLGWEEYNKRLATWDEIRQCVGLKAEFYEGAELLMFPPTWLTECEQRYFFIQNRSRIARGLGIDPAEGGADTSLCVVDEYGIIHLESFKTPDTSIIAGHIVNRMLHFNLPSDRVCIDRGGGGKQIADQLKSIGYDIRSVGFGESTVPDPSYLKGFGGVEEARELREERYSYYNKRAMLYGELRELIKPLPDHVTNPWIERRNSRQLANTPPPPERQYKLPYIWANLRDQYGCTQFGWSIPPGKIYEELRRQLAPLPIMYTNEGRLRLPPKNRKPGAKDTGGEKTLVDILGCSPDEADATVLAVHAMLHPDERPVIGVMQARKP